MAPTERELRESQRHELAWHAFPADGDGDVLLPVVEIGLAVTRSKT
jgi:hypothetical protein